MQGDGPDQTTPWFRIAAQEPALVVNQLQVYLQSMALGLFFIGMVLTLHNRFSTARHSQQLTVSDRSDSIDEREDREMAPIPDGGLPPGWTLEQWKWYGHEYLEDSK